MSDDIQIIAWFSPRGEDIRGKAGTVRVNYCRVCDREVTRHALVDPETATEEQIAEARAAGRQDGETFFGHLYSAHRDLFGEGSEAPEFVNS